MKKFRINYYFDGKGSCVVKAKTQEEAEEKFHEGEFSEDTDDSSNYNINSTEEIK